MAADKLTGWVGPKVTHQAQPSIPPQAKLTGSEMEELRTKFDSNADEIDGKQSKSEEIPFNEESIFPNAFNGDPQLFMAIVLAIFGFSMILILEKLSKN